MYITFYYNIKQIDILRVWSPNKCSQNNRLRVGHILHRFIHPHNTYVTSLLMYDVQSRCLIIVHTITDHPYYISIY